MHLAQLKTINDTTGMKFNNLGEMSHSIENLEELIDKETQRQRNEHKKIYSNLI
jgi:pyruvate formate-lyase activating enzyme-like uncharacterized protein